MIFGGGCEDVALGDHRSVHRTLTGSCNGSRDLGGPAPTGSAEPDLRRRQAEAVLDVFYLDGNHLAAIEHRMAEPTIASKTVTEARMFPTAEDEIGRGEPSDANPATVSKMTFRCFFWTLFVVFVIAECALAAVISRIASVRDESSRVGGLVVINIILAWLAADGILKRMGRSLSGKTVEVRRRAAAVTEEDVADNNVAEVRVPASLIRGLLITCLTICLIGVFVVSTLVHGSLMPDIGWIETFHDTFGKPIITRLITRPSLRDRDGQVLMTLNPIYTWCENQERLAKFIRAGLPKPKNGLFD